MKFQRRDYINAVLDFNKLTLVLITTGIYRPIVSIMPSHLTFSKCCFLHNFKIFGIKILFLIQYY
jgi:hypothetical protein